MSSAQFESLSQELACIWLSWDTDEEALQHQAQAIVVQAEGLAQARLSALSHGWQAVRVSIRIQNGAGDPYLAPMEDLAALAAASGWPRAQALALAAQMRAVVMGHAGRQVDWQPLVSQMEGLAAAMPADWPGVERLWFEISLGWLEMMRQAPGTFLERFLYLQRVACPPAAHQRTWLNLRHLLAYALISAADLEGACACSLELLATSERLGLSTPALYYNPLLLYGLSGRFDQAQALLATRPHLRQPGFWHESPALQTVVQWVDAHSPGSHWDRSWLLRELPIPDARGSAVHANHTWLLADLCNLAGEHRRAAQSIQDFLDHDANTHGALSALNGTMLYQTLSRAHEALGDAAAALKALRQAEQHVHTWTLRGTEARLQALHRAAPGVQAGLQQRRVSMLHQARGADALAPARQLVAHVSHEMRNPLNGVLGVISLLGMSNLDDTQRRQLQLAESSARMALTLCNDLLDLAKIDAGRLELNAAPCELAPALDEVVQTFMPTARHKGLRLSLELAPGLPSRVLIDRLRLQQVLMNLVSNAIKFTHHGRVVLAASPVANTGSDRLRVVVEDTGMGIAAHERARLFQEFSQANRSVAASYGGTGLGLALCRKLVGAMGGHIDMSSEPGIGSRFWFEVLCPPCTEPA